MKEVTGNLWTYPADVRVITTNGTVKKNGECVMGRGCALEAKKRYAGIALTLGALLASRGNVPMCLRSDHKDAPLWSFPVKHQWYQRADINLIEQSAILLCDALDHHYPNDEGHVIVLPRPGCGNGGLNWNDVRKVLEPILDDRFHVITFD